MRVTLMVNARSGVSSGSRLADRFTDALIGAGHETTRFDIGPDRPAPDPQMLRDGRVEVLVAIGGDGTARAGAGLAMATGVPLYHVPGGTVNLFARALGMTDRPETLIAALGAGSFDRVDAATANDESFLLMASLGMDAEVVAEVTRLRRESITRRNYLGPMWRRFLAYKPAVLNVEVDGERVDRDEPAMVVVANCRGYMWGLDPARRARMDDGLIDVVIMPVRSRLSLVFWMIRCLTGGHLRNRDLVYRTGRRVVISAPEPQVVQLDGDPPRGNGGAPIAELSIELHPDALPVVRPLGGPE